MFCEWRAGAFRVGVCKARSKEYQEHTLCAGHTSSSQRSICKKKHTSKSYRHLFFPTHCSRSNSLTNSLVVDFLLLFVEVEPLLVFINVAAAAVVAARTIAIILLADAVARPPTAP